MNNRITGRALEGAPGNLQATTEGGSQGDVWVAVEPTQVRRPWRATARTVFQALIALAALAPLVAAAVEEATGYDLEGVPFIVVALAASAAVTRVMAVPQVNAFLARFVPFLAAAPTDTSQE